MLPEPQKSPLVFSQQCLTSTVSNFHLKVCHLRLVLSHCIHVGHTAHTWSHIAHTWGHTAHMWVNAAHTLGQHSTHMWVTHTAHLWGHDSTRSLVSGFCVAFS